MTNIDEKLKFGVIGCGWISKQFSLLTRFIKNVKIVAATDPKIELAKKIAGKNHAYSTTKEMYSNENLDIVYIATPHYLHKPMIQEALEQGVHVLCEKPVGTSFKDAKEIYAISKKYPNLKLGFNYNYRYDHKCIRLAEGIRNGQLGDVYYANCSIYFSRNEEYFQKGMWRTKKETAGGGTLLFHGSHIIDIMIWALGEPLYVMGEVDTLKHKTEVEDLGLAVVEFEGKKYGQINDSSFIEPKMSIFRDQVILEIFGEKGRCKYKGPWPLSSLKWKGVKKPKIKKQVKGFSHFGRSIKAFTEWVLYDKKYFNTIQESSKVLALISAIYRSSESGKKEKVEKLENN
ncbi:MAG: Gfo/Idh/MocA family protein [Promethearchaeota archaeon]